MTFLDDDGEITLKEYWRNYEEYDINNMILDTQIDFEYDYKYKTMLRNRLSPIVLLKQLNIPYWIDAKGKLHIKEI